MALLAVIAIVVLLSSAVAVLFGTASLPKVHPFLTESRGTAVTVTALPTRPLQCDASHATNTHNIGPEHCFWWGGQPKLCNLLQAKVNTNSTIQALNLTLNCSSSNLHTGLGTGNWVLALYMSRLAAIHFGVQMQFACSDGTKERDILPWLQGCYTPATGPPLESTNDSLCDWDMRRIPLQLMATRIRRDMQDMVHQATGLRELPTSLFGSPVNTPFFGNVVLDQVAIHLRCGDVLYMNRPKMDYGLIRFRDYVRIIDPSVTSIGIITQPFDPSLGRSIETNHTQDCQRVVMAFAAVLQTNFPHATIAIRNGKDETLPLAYARLVLANQSIIGLSSFTAFPVIGAYGVSFFQEGRMQVNQWLNQVQMDHLRLWNPDFINTKRIMRIGLNATMQWLLEP